MIDHKHISLSVILTMAAFEMVAGQELAQAPRLVVSISIDQLRSDYLEAFAPLYGEGGFKRLLNNGLVYPNASYPFTPVDRASAVASVSTGTTPYYNGIVGGRWLNKETLRPVTCDSPGSLSVSTIGDELKVATAGKSVVYAISPFCDAAIMSAGHAANGAAWIDDRTGKWTSSSFYSPYAGWLNAYSSLTGVISAKEWTPISDLVGNFSYFLSGGLSKPFKHKFNTERKFIQYKTCGLVNSDVTSLAIQCMTSTSMGQDAVTDLLSITYYAGNYDHKPLNECQMELQDTYVRLDEDIARLLNDIDQRIGLSKVMVMVTGTGYTDEDNADYEKFKIPSGTFYLNRTANLLNMYLGALWGQGQYIETSFGREVFINHKLIESKQISLAEATKRSQEFLLQMSGVRNVYTSQQLLSEHNPQLAKVRNGFFAERCGDIIIEVAPGWKIINENTQESTHSRASYIPFPIIFLGAATKAHKVETPVTTDRIAPTIAKAIRIRAPNACMSEPLF